jgi:KaiC/GvpD/RAD55 family RecA-like ATPase
MGASTPDTRIPFGFRSLDSRFEGMPAGSAVLLSGGADAGTDAYANTSAAMIMMARHETQFYESQTRNSLTAPDDLPDSVHYLTLTRSKERVIADLETTLGAKQFSTLEEHLTIADFSDEYLARTPVPQTMFRPGTEERQEAGTEADEPEAYESLLDEICNHLESVGKDAVVVFNSLTDMQRALEFGLDRADFIGFLVGLRRAATMWGGLTYVIYHREPELIREEEDINAALDGSIYFSYHPDRTQRRRTMSIGSFRGNLDKRHQVMYDTGITEQGFTISTSQSIR